MGGHGGLNILPQKSWNVYNFDNREKVRQDEEAAAKEEQLKREQSRRRDAEFRLQRLRATRGLAPLIKESESEQTPASAAEPAVEPESEPKSGHINLFEGIRIFDPIKLSETKEEKEYDGKFKRKKMKKEEAAPRVVGPEEETCRFGYGLAGKGVKLPWYLQKSNKEAEDEDVGHDGASSGGNEVKSVRNRILEVREKRLKRERLEKEREQAVKRRGDRGANEVMKKSGRKTIEEPREERLKRERREKERERAVIKEKSRRDGGFSRR